MHIHKLGVKLHEYSLMKMFMTSLEGNARSWYEGLSAGSLYSLRDFHTVFHEHFKDQYPSFLLFLEVMKDSINSLEVGYKQDDQSCH